MLSFTVAAPCADPAPSPSNLPLPDTPPSPLWSPLLCGLESLILLLFPEFPGTPCTPPHRHLYIQGRNILHTRPADSSHHSDQPTGLLVLDTPPCPHRSPPCHSPPSADIVTGWRSSCHQPVSCSGVPDLYSSRVSITVIVLLTNMFSACCQRRPQAP